MELDRPQFMLIAAGLLASAVVACGSGLADTTPPGSPSSIQQPTVTAQPSRAPSETPKPTATTAPPQHPIVFVSNRDSPDQAHLYLINPDGSGLAPVQTGFNRHMQPAWSPDRTWIAFWSDVSGEELIYKIALTGNNLVQLTDFSSAAPSWSSDGTRLVFHADHQNEPTDTPDLYAIDSDGANLLEILDDPEVLDAFPRWSPLGPQVLFVSLASGKAELYLMNIDGTGRQQITQSREPVTYGAWSPDGKKISFVYGAGTVTDLYVMNADGSHVVRLTADSATDRHPAWSPDGRRLVFSSNRGGRWDLWLIDADGTNLVQLTDDPFYDTDPDW